MKRTLGLAFLVAMALGITAYAAGTDDTGGATGGAAGTSGAAGATGAQMGQQGAGGVTGGAAATVPEQAMNQFKDEMNSRLDKVNDQIKTLDQNIDQVPAAQQSSMKIKLDQIEGMRDGVKKMIGDAKTQEDMSMVSNEMNQLEQATKALAVQMQRSKTSGNSGGTTGGAAGTSGGASGGSASAETRDAFKNSMDKRLDRVNNQIKTMDDKIQNMKDESAQGAMNMQMDAVKSQRDSVKKMIGDAKTPQEMAVATNQMVQLEASVKKTAAAMGMKASQQKQKS